MQVKFVMSINEHEHVVMSSDQRSPLYHPTRLLIYEQQTGGIPEYSVLKVARRVKIALLNIKFTSSIN